MVLMGTPKGKRSLGRHKNRWEDNIKVYLKIGCNGVGSGKEHLASCCVNDNEPSGSIECGDFLDYLRNC
jgi:hypothetical protein